MMSTGKKTITFTIYGEPASKANKRRLVRNKATGKTMFIKSAKALGYAGDFAAQCPKLAPLMEGDLSVTIKIFYASRRPDLDESVILDCMQAEFHIDKQTKAKRMIRGGIYANDRQVREKHIFWDVDPANPRAEITVDVIED